MLSIINTLSSLYPTHMPRRSNKSIVEILPPTNVPFVDRSGNDKHIALLERKITLATVLYTV